MEGEPQILKELYQSTELKEYMLPDESWPLLRTSCVPDTRSSFHPHDSETGAILIIYIFLKDKQKQEEMKLFAQGHPGSLATTLSASTVALGGIWEGFRVRHQVSIGLCVQNLDRQRGSRGSSETISRSGTQGRRNGRRTHEEN